MLQLKFNWIMLQYILYTVYILYLFFYFFIFLLNLFFFLFDFNYMLLTQISIPWPLFKQRIGILFNITFQIMIFPIWYGQESNIMTLNDQVKYKHITKIEYQLSIVELKNCNILLLRCFKGFFDFRTESW